MVDDCDQSSCRCPRPAPNEPGTLRQQLSAVEVAIYLGRRRGTSAAEQWQDARRLVMPHAQQEVGH